MAIHRVKSVVISRKPGKDRDGLWSAFIGLFNENNPHLKGREPFEVVEIEEVEKIRLHELRNVSFYLMGNDLVINNMTQLKIDNESGIVTLSGKQELPE